MLSEPAAVTTTTVTTTTVTTDAATAGDAARTSGWEWRQGEQPVFSPRRAPVPAPALARLPPADTPREVVLGWFHRYPARFAADVVTSMLAQAVIEAARLVETVLDPFCGTGAVVSAGRQLGLAATGLELTTLGAAIGRLRLDPPPDPWAAAAHCEGLIHIPPARVSGLGEELTGWLGQENARLLTAWRPAVEAVEDTRLRRFALVALSQSLRPSSRWLADSVKVTADPHRVPIPLAHSLRRWARQLARDCQAEQTALSGADASRHNGDGGTSADRGAGVDGSIGANGGTGTGRVARDSPRHPPATVLQADARLIPLPDASVDAIVTSPPYFVTYDYFDIQRLSYLAFGWPVRRELQIGAKYRHPSLPAAAGPPTLPTAFRTWYEEDFGAERSTLGRALRAYTDGLRRHLSEAARVVAPGGAVAYSLANTVRAGRVFDLVGGFSELLAEAGFVHVRASPRPQDGRRILPAGRNPATGRFAGSTGGAGNAGGTGNAGVREYVVVARRPGRARPGR